LSFQTLKLPEALIQACTELGFTEPTPIQALSLPILLSGQDLIGQARTGSGKTLAFSLWILSNLDLSQRRPQGLVLGPTRELCTQVSREIRRVGKRFPGLRVLPLTGGEPVYGQRRALEEGAHLIVGTPGRILDLLKREAVDTAGISKLVLDEADRMLELGFSEALAEILPYFRPSRQTALFSATFPDSVEKLAEGVLKTPARVIAPEPPPEIRQFSWDPHDPEAELVALLKYLNPASSLVFCNFKASAAALSLILEDAGLTVACLQGDLEQSVRDQELARFRAQAARVLVATDVAARGLDITGLELVINMELPSSQDLYTHRIGRTGRAGQMGIAISRVNKRLNWLAGELEDVQALQPLHTEPHPSWVCLKLSAGRRHKLRPGDILGALTGAAGGLKGEEVGAIEIREQVSFVAVAEAALKRAQRGLEEGKVKGLRLRAVRV
jgi:ATP-independent RNA helicase DbpA